MHEIELKPSRRLRLFLLGGAVLTLAALLLAEVPAGAAWVLGIAVGLGVWHGRRTASGARLRIAADGCLQSRDEAAEWRDIEVLDDSFVSPALIVMRYRTAGGRVRSLTLLTDSAAADDLRRLRVSLRWARRIRSDTSSPDAG